MLLLMNQKFKAIGGCKSVYHYSMNINDDGNVQFLSLNLMNCFVKWKYYQRYRVLPVHHTFLDAQIDQTILKVYNTFIQWHKQQI